MSPFVPSLDPMAALQALEIVPTAVLLVDARLRVVLANASARRVLELRDGICCDGGALRGASSDVTIAFRARVAEAARDGTGRGAVPGASLLVPRPSGARPWVVTVTRLRERDLGAGAEQPLAAVLIADSEPASCLPPARLQELFGLTPSEARVALLLAEGKGLKHVASRLGVSLSTVKTHVQRALEKTGTRRQAELTRIIVQVGALLATGRAAA
jgi:DNA-binding CsgD family transcriptional regulator